MHEIIIYKAFLFVNNIVPIEKFRILENFELTTRHWERNISGTQRE